MPSWYPANHNGQKPAGPRSGPGEGGFIETRLFSNANILSWLQYFAQNMDIDLEIVKILNCPHS